MDQKTTTPEAIGSGKKEQDETSTETDNNEDTQNPKSQKISMPTTEDCWKKRLNNDILLRLKMDSN